MKPEDDFENVYELIEHAIDYAFEGKMTLKFYDFLKYRKTKKYEVEAFIESSTAKELSELVLDMEAYIKGVMIMLINNCVRHMVTYLNLKQEK